MKNKCSATYFTDGGRTTLQCSDAAEESLTCHVCGAGFCETHEEHADGEEDNAGKWICSDCSAEVRP